MASWAKLGYAAMAMVLLTALAAGCGSRTPDGTRRPGGETLAEHSAAHLTPVVKQPVDAPQQQERINCTDDVVRSRKRHTNVLSRSTTGIRYG